MQSEKKGLNALQLKILAMIFMVMDHAWATLPVKGDWLTCVGRMTFPIFAFLIAEGYAHTRDPKAYLRRMLVWAVITEIPFNFITVGGFFNPLHQNVLFTFSLSLYILGHMEKARARGGALALVSVVAWLGIGYVLGFLTFVDYFGYGVVITLMFWLFRGNRLAQFLMLTVINVFVMEGQVYPVTLLGMEFSVPQQTFALLALIPIWLYNGERGPDNKLIRRLCYAFYPAHMVVLVLLARFVFR